MKGKCKDPRDIDGLRKRLVLLWASRIDIVRNYVIGREFFAEIGGYVLRHKGSEEIPSDQNGRNRIEETNKI